jgi:SAM-dependent methyltransferase
MIGISDSNKTISASSWVDAKMRYYDGRELDPLRAARFYEHFGSARAILDLGCGLGCLGRMKPRSEIEVYGLDIDNMAVRVASQFEHAQLWDLESAQLPFEDSFFDAVLARDILEHLQRPWLVVRETYRVLKKDGIVIASVPVAKSHVVWNDYTHVRGYTRKALSDMFGDAGFHIASVWHAGGIPGAGRLGFKRWVPALLRLPVLQQLYGVSLEIKAIKL